MEPVNFPGIGEAGGYLGKERSHVGGEERIRDEETPIISGHIQGINSRIPFINNGA